MSFHTLRLKVSNFNFRLNLIIIRLNSGGSLHSCKELHFLIPCSDLGCFANIRSTKGVELFEKYSDLNSVSGCLLNSTDEFRR